MLCEVEIADADTCIKRPQSLIVVIPMYRELSETKVALRSCLDFGSYGFNKGIKLNVVVILDGCGTTNDHTLRAIQLELGPLDPPEADKNFGCLVFTKDYCGVQVEILVKGAGVKKGKRMSQIMAFDYVSAKPNPPSVCIFQDCDVYIPPMEIKRMFTLAHSSRVIVCPQILSHSNIFFEGMLPSIRGDSEVLTRGFRNLMAMFGACPLIPGPCAVYPLELLSMIMEKYGANLTNVNTSVFNGNAHLVEDSYMGWCATAAGLVPRMVFNHHHVYWNLPDRLFPLLRQRRRWKAGQISTALKGHPHLHEISWCKSMAMRLIDLYLNVLVLMWNHFFTLIVGYTLAVDYFGSQWPLFFQASSLLRLLLAPWINSENDRFFTCWTALESAAVSIWLLLLIPLHGITADVLVFLLPVVSVGVALATVYAYKYGIGTSMSLLCSELVSIVFFELHQIELDYALLMFNDVAWGNRETGNEKKVGNDRLYVAMPHDRVWSGTNDEICAPTMCSRFMTFIPFMWRLAIAAIIWFQLISVDMSMWMRMPLTMSFKLVPLVVTIFLPQLTKQRPYRSSTECDMGGGILSDLLVLSKYNVSAEGEIVDR